MGTKSGCFKSFSQVSVWTPHQALDLLITLLSSLEGETNQEIGATVFVSQEPDRSELQVCLNLGIWAHHHAAFLCYSVLPGDVNYQYNPSTEGFLPSLLSKYPWRMDTNSYQKPEC